VGGSIAHGDPAADFPAVALALGARLALRSTGGERIVAATDFFVGPFLTALQPGELVVEIRIPMPGAGSGSAYEKVEHPASGFALAGAAALVRRDGSTAVALTGVGACPFLVSEGSGPEIYGDDRFPAEYRRHLANVLTRRALARAGERAT
jgi:carbon-monoxide dehydrogenase medium subunit